MNPILGERRRESILDVVKKTKIFPFKWIAVLALSYFTRAFFRSLWRTSSMVTFPKVKKVYLFGIWESNYDLEDFQWKNFRKMLFHVSIFFIIYLAISKFLKRFCRSLKQRKLIFLLIEILFVYYLHGVYIFWILLFLVINFSFTFLIHMRLNVLMSCLTWIFPIFLLFFNEYYEHKYDELLDYLPSNSFFDTLLLRTQKYNFVVGFNMMILRMISFNMDLYLSYTDLDFLREKMKARRRREQQKFGNMDEDYDYVECKPTVDNFTNKNLPIEKYTLLNYLIFVFYPPLYVAGPISNFNNFLRWFEEESSSQKKKNFFSRRNILYFIRTLFAFSVLEIYNACFYVTSANNRLELYEERLEAFEWLWLGLGNVLYIYLKFNVIWKYFRLISLLDGVEVYENMGACIIVFSSVRSFWRDWHSSFYQWNVRYIYLFLGGKKTSPIRNTFLIFFFVAIWHDIHLNLLVYGWVIVLIFILEDTVTSFLYRNFPKHGGRRSNLQESDQEEKWYIYLLRIARIWLFTPTFILIITIGFTGLSQSMEYVSQLCSFGGVFYLFIAYIAILTAQVTGEIIRMFTGKEISFKGEY